MDNSPGDGSQPDILGQESLDIDMDDHDEEDVVTTNITPRERASSGADAETATYRPEPPKRKRDHSTHPADRSNTDSEGLKPNGSEIVLAGGSNSTRHGSAGINLEVSTRGSKQSANGPPAIGDRLGRSKSTFAALPLHKDSSAANVVPKRRVPNAQVLATLQKRMHRKNAANSKSTTGSLKEACTPSSPVSDTGRGGRLSEQPPLGPEPRDEVSRNSDTPVAGSPKHPRAVILPGERPDSILTPDEEDHSWMAQTHNPEDDVKEAESLNKKADALRAKILKKSRQKKPFLEEEITLIQVRRELTKHSRRVSGDKNILASVEQPDEEDSLFIPEERQVSDDEGMDEAEPSKTSAETNEREQDIDHASATPDDEGEILRRALAGEADSNLAQTSRTKTNKRAPHAKTAKEVHKRNMEKLAQKKAQIGTPAKPGRGKGPATKSASGQKSKNSRKAKAPSRKRPNSSKAKNDRSMVRWQQHGDPAKALFSLLYHNTIRDRQDQGDLGPTTQLSGAKEKTQMLKDLVASVPEDVNKRLITNERTDLLKASRAFGHGRMTGDNGKWLLKGMKSSLLHHQLLGTQWMVTREMGDSEPYGGLVADAMGTGKTLQMLATMIGNPPDLQANDRKTTLLIVPSSVLRQWEDEIASHVTKGIFKKVYAFRAVHRLSMENLQDQDIILCTYMEVMNSFPYPSSKERADMDQNDVGDQPDNVPFHAPELMRRQIHNWIHEHWVERGPLHWMKFYRVVLDEGHTIKNWRSRTNLACQAIEAGLRWVLTGTPILNRLEEFYPYFRFLRIKQAEHFPTFKRQFCMKNDPKCASRVAHFLSFMMIRRRLSDKILNRPIVELPQTHPSLERVNFDGEERCLYKAVEAKFRNHFNSYLKDGTVEKNYQNILVMLLRLRQATCHPFLLQETIKNTFNLEDLRQLQSALGKNSEKQSVVGQVGQWIQERHDERTEATASNNAGRGANAGAGSAPSDRSRVGSSCDLGKFLGKLDEREMLGRCICNLCEDVATVPQITDCNHVFCHECIQSECEKSAARGDASSKCPKCEHIFSTVKPYANLEARDDADKPEEVNERASQARKRRASSKEAPEDWIDLPGDLLPSAKTTAIKDKIHEWLREAPDDKIIIFTQWRLMGRIIGRLCQSEGWEHAHYDGTMTPDNRHETQKAFQKPESTIKILIAGLKCGGQGLNLTAANRVISVDLWWNYSVELQAFGRVFRYGQKKETHFCRIVVKQSVDDRLLGMQAEKIKLVENALMDNDRKVKRLSTAELASLFGYYTEDADGKPIVVDEDAVIIEINSDDSDESSLGAESS